MAVLWVEAWSSWGAAGYCELDGGAMGREQQGAEEDFAEGGGAATAGGRAQQYEGRPKVAE